MNRPRVQTSVRPLQDILRTAGNFVLGWRPAGQEGPDFPDKQVNHIDVQQDFADINHRIYDGFSGFFRIFVGRKAEIVPAYGQKFSLMVFYKCLKLKQMIQRYNDSRLLSQNKLNYRFSMFHDGAWSCTITCKGCVDVLLFKEIYDFASAFCVAPFMFGDKDCFFLVMQ